MSKDSLVAEEAEKYDEQRLQEVETHRLRTLDEIYTFDAASEQNFTDAQLLTYIMGGEDWALAEIHDRYARLVFSIALRTLHDEASAEEVVQQVFIKVWQRAQDYQAERGKFSSWLSTIAYHQCIDELRHRHAPVITDSVDWESLDQLVVVDRSVPDEKDRVDQVWIREALQQIPAQERTVIELAYWGGMSQREIADHYHIPLGTVKTRMRLGMQRLKLLLQESI